MTYLPWWQAVAKVRLRHCVPTHLPTLAVPPSLHINPPTYLNMSTYRSGQKRLHASSIYGSKTYLPQVIIYLSKLPRLPGLVTKHVWSARRSQETTSQVVSYYHTLCMVVVWDHWIFILKILTEEMWYYRKLEIKDSRGILCIWICWA